MADAEPLFNPTTGILDREVAAGAGLRGQLALALERIAWSEFADGGESVVTLVDANAALDAIVPIVEERLFRANNWDNGKCTWCRAIVSEQLAAGLGRQVQPHRMHCRFYVGPVEHRKVGGAQALTHWSTSCSCGRSYDAERGGCPNVEETWRGAPQETLC